MSASSQYRAAEVKVTRFAFTANNITYAALGDHLKYWQLFPAPEGFGIVPMWGLGEVIGSKHPRVAAGETLFGYFPMATHLVIEAARVSKTARRLCRHGRQGPLRATLHRHFGEQMKYSGIVGLTHRKSSPSKAAQALPGGGAKPQFFFAPDHIRARARNGARRLREAVWRRMVGVRSEARSMD